VTATTTRTQLPDTDDETKGTWRHIRLLLSIAFRADALRAALVIIPIESALSYVPLWSGKRVVDGIAGSDLTLARTWIIIGAVGTLVWMTLLLLRFNLDMRLREHVGYEVDRRLLDLTASLPTLDHFEQPKLADRLELLRTERYGLVNGVPAVSYTSDALAGLLISGVLLASIHPLALGITLLGLPALFIAPRAQKLVERATEDTAEDVRRALHLYDLAADPGAGKELRVFGLEDEVVARYSRTWRSVEHTVRRAATKAALYNAGALLLLGVSYAGTVVFVARRAASGDATPGDLVLALGVATQLNSQLQQAIGMVVWLASTLRAAGRYQWLIDHARAADALRPAAPASPPQRLADAIELRDVSFTYEGATTPSLSEVDLVLPAGKTIALVGENGAGKTTLIKLLSALYRPTSGVIAVDGTDLAHMQPEAWRDRIAAGFQDFVRFELVAGETIGVGDVERLGDDDAALTALDRASSRDLLDALEEGLATPLGLSLDGRDLSGGQWQKLALARAMMRRDPLLLVLDEPTAALDAETEHRLFEQYAEAARDAARRTGGITILVSHRFSTVRMADLIVVLAGGRVVEQGTHAELMARDAGYAELYRLQAAAYL
jgi:ATP-binding cassette subfamily B protein